MSAAQMQSDGDQQWGCLESLGLSPRELVLAEALQMEYDALSRLKQESKVPSTRGGPEPGKGPCDGERSALHDSLSPRGSNLIHGLSGSDPMLHLQPGVSNPSSANLEPRNYSKEPLYILESPAKSEYESSHMPSPKNFTPPDDPPPAVPPRNPLSSSNSQVWRGSVPRDVNLFTPEVELPKVSSGESLNYEDLNEALTRLNTASPPTPVRWSNGDTAGKPVARSKTLPPQVPPRTYLPLQKSNKNQRRVSADPVTIGSRLNGFGYELFQVYEERDEEVAAFCHMLDVLRLDYPSSDRSKNTGFVWSPGVAQDELQQGLGVSVKVTVISDHFREPLIFTCDGSSTVDLLIYQTLCYAHDDLVLIDVEDYLLKVCGHEEFLKNNQALASLEYIQQCLKFDWEIRLFLTKRSTISQELVRMEEDDETPSTMNHSILLQERPIKQTVTREALTLLLDTFHNEAESFVLSEMELPLRVERLVQSVKALCSSLASVETPDITAALSQLPACPCRLQPRVLKDVSVLASRENRGAVLVLPTPVDMFD